MIVVKTNRFKRFQIVSEQLSIYDCWKWLSNSVNQSQRFVIELEKCLVIDDKCSERIKQNVTFGFSLSKGIVVLDTGTQMTNDGKFSR